MALLTNNVSMHQNQFEPLAAGVSFNLLLIASTRERASTLQRIAVETQKLLPAHVLPGYPRDRELGRLLDSTEPEIVMLDLADPAAAADCAAQVYLRLPSLPILGIAGPLPPDPAMFGHALTRVLAYPPDVADLVKVIDESILHGRGRIEQNMFSFLPAKAGSGASTIVLYAAAALAGHFQKRVLVIDADLRSSALSIMLNLREFHSLQEVLRSAAELDAFRLNSAVTRVHNVDMLLSSRLALSPTPNWEHYFRLLELVRSRYDVVLVDMPEVVNPATRELVRRSRVVFNVCTPEMTSLKLAERRHQELMEAGLSEDRVQILLNRWHTTEVKPQEIEAFLHLPVTHVFPNDYKSVRAAMVEGRLVPGNTRLGKDLQDFAGQLIGVEKQVGSKLRQLLGYR
jgi:MinD-like ATPase involved in chromosome partitioning or flagellar assembly